MSRWSPALGGWFVTVDSAVLFGDRFERSAGLLDSILRLRRRRGLPLHVPGRIGAAALQRLHMIDNVPRTRTARVPSRRTWMRPLEAVLRGLAARDPALVIANAARTVGSSRAGSRGRMNYRAPGNNDDAMRGRGSAMRGR